MKHTRLMAVDGFLLERVSVVRGDATVLWQVGAHLPAGSCSAVMGASGSGKTTLLRLLNGLIDPTAGRVLLDGVALSQLDVLALRRRVGLVAQAPVLLTDAVLDEVRVGRPDLPDGRVAELLARVGLSEQFAARPTAGLSGGEAQRLCLARSLAVEPEVLLLDEPTSALDGPSAAIIATLVRDHVAAGGTVVLVSHDHGLVASVADQVLIFERGHLVSGGRPDEIDHRSTS
jgi:UDP-glucose/iron transport system ATP-binding protein